MRSAAASPDLELRAIQQRPELRTESHAPLLNIRGSQSHKRSTLFKSLCRLLQSIMTSISRKRCTPDSEGEPHLEQPSPKKRRLEPTLPQTPPPEKDLQPKLAMSVAFDTHPKELLLRSVAETLKYVGFHGASQEALEAFASRVDTCKSTIPL